MRKNIENQIEPMKKFTFLIIITAFYTFSSTAQWEQTNGPSGGTIQDFAVDEYHTYVATNQKGIFKLSDDGGNWTGINKGLPGLSINALVANNNVLLVSVQFEGLFRSTDHGQSWTPVNGGTLTSSINTFATKGSRIFAGTTGVYLSEDDGNTWFSVNNGLPNVSVQAFAINGSNIYAGTSTDGVFVSSDDGNNW